MPNRKIFILAVVFPGMLCSAQARSHLPPLQPREFAAYGPIEICSGRFNLIAGQGEALHVSGDIARVISDDRILAVKFANDRAWFASEGPGESAQDVAGFSVRRFSGPVPDAGGTVKFAPEGLGDTAIRYALSTGNGTSDVIVGATSFRGDDRDRELLQRVRPGDTRSAGCVSLWHEMSHIDDPNPGRRQTENMADVAEVYAADSTPGPDFHCVAGAGFRVEMGESLRRPWRTLARSGPLYLESSGTRITIEERGGTLSRYDDQNRAEHPMALVQYSKAYFFPGIGVQPLEGDDLVRREATWRFDLGAGNNSVALSISFPAANASAGMAFLERIEFVDPHDPRCAPDGRD